MAIQKAIDFVNGLKWGIEIETKMPRDADVSIGSYHRGVGVHWLPRSPEVDHLWTAERDGSIVCSEGEVPCEFVSPVMHGLGGIKNVIESVGAIKRLGGKVNRSCGIHVTVTFPANDAVALARLLCIVANHERAIYAATGTTSRERGHYCKSIKDAGNENNAKQRASYDRFHLVNLTHLAAGRNRVEFRAFSGSLNPTKVIGFIMLVLGIVTLAMAGSTRKSPWNYVKKGVKSCWDRAGFGEGQTELCRLFYRLGWIHGWYKGDDRGTFFGVPGNDPAAVDLDGVKDKLLAMAKKYDDEIEAHRRVVQMG